MTTAGPRPDPGFVGRSDEVARLTDALRAARGGRSPVWLVLGEAGIGKSRLAARVAEEARTLGYDVAWTEAVGADPFSALAGLRPGPVGPGGEDRRWERLEAVAAALAAREPVLVIVEDAHLADASSRWVLERLARHLPGVTAPLLITARSDEPDTGIAGLVAAAEVVLRLTGLSEADTARLAELAAPGAVVDGAELWARTGGIPLFVREAAVLAADDGAVPAATSVLRRRIERLEPDAQRCLAALALAPRGTSLVVLADALDRPVEAVVAAIDAARAAGLVADDPNGDVRLRHALLGEAATDLPSPADRSALRLALAEALAADGSVAARAAAARQRLLALPAGDPDLAATAAIEAVVALRAGGDGAEASTLAGLAATVMARYGDRAAAARAHVERGEALLELGESAGAGAAFEAARALEDVLDARTRARAEVGRAWFANPFVPDPAAVHRLAAAMDALDDGDGALQVGLLGRIAATSVPAPTVRDLGRRAGEEAVAMARRLGDPQLLVQALADRHLAPVTAAEWSARGAAADEIVELGERTGRPDLALLGYEWQFGERLARADLAGAERALGRLQIYAQLSPSPRWRFSADLRRAGLLSLAGEGDRALHTLEGALAVGRPWLHPGELSGIELGFRTSTAFIHDSVDPSLRRTFEAHALLADAIPAPFLQAQLALAAWVVGEPDRAREHLGRARAGLDALASGLEAPYALNACGLVAAALEDRRTAREVGVLLEPLASRLTAGSGSVVVPFATTLGLLAELARDHAAATAYHRRGIALAERVGSAALARRCRALADRPATDTAPATAPDAGPARATITRGADGWRFDTRYGTAVVEESRGLLQLVEVLRAGGREVSALDLAGATGGAPVVQSDLGPALDARAKREYRARIAELRADIDDAEAMNDGERATGARLELDALLDELGRAVGLHGRDRWQGATHERARVNVTRSIRRAIAAVAARAPELGAHLDVSVRTGAHCRYQPDPAAAVVWEVATGPR